MAHLWTSYPCRYGFAPKGSSIVMFRTAELRHCMYTFVTEWTGGIYATPTILGSRPGGVVAATWAAMINHGVEGCACAPPPRNATPPRPTLI